MARLMLWVRCTTCGETFDTGIRIDRRNFARATLASNYHTCPRCHSRGTYNKEEYLLHDEPPGRPAPRPGGA